MQLSDLCACMYVCVCVYIYIYIYIYVYTCLHGISKAQFPNVSRASSCTYIHIVTHARTQPPQFAHIESAVCECCKGLFSYIHTHSCTRTHARTHTHTHTHTPICTYRKRSLRMSQRPILVHTYTHTNTHARTQARKHASTHTHTHTQRFARYRKRSLPIL